MNKLIFNLNSFFKKKVPPKKPLVTIQNYLNRNKSTNQIKFKLPLFSLRVLPLNHRNYLALVQFAAYNILQQHY